MSSAKPFPEGQYVDLPNSYRMHYLEQGDGSVVVFLHGSGSGASGYSNFKQNYPYLADAGYRVIVPDHIGYGYSDKPDDVQYHLDFFVECIKQTLDALEVKTCTLVGNSLGGAIAIKFALDYPQMMEKLVLMAPGGIENQPDYFTMPGMAMMKEVFMAAEPVTPARMKAFFQKAFVVNPDCVDDALVQERWETMKLQNQQVIKTMVVPNMEDRLHEIACPVLAFWGVNENMMPETGIMKLARKIQHIRLVLVSQCGHWVQLEHAGMFNRATLDFLDHG